MKVSTRMTLGDNALGKYSYQYVLDLVVGGSGDSGSYRQMV